MAIDFLGAQMAALLDCVTENLDAHDRPIERAFLNPGLEVPWDSCGADCGQAWVRVLELFPTGRPFPARDTHPGCHPAALAATLGVGVLRCVPTVDNNGNAPNPDAVTAAALDMTSDQAILTEAIECCYAPLTVREGGTDTLVFNVWNPLGPSGGCAGGEWQIYLQVPVCGCP